MHGDVHPIWTILLLESSPFFALSFSSGSRIIRWVVAFTVKFHHQIPTFIQKMIFFGDFLFLHIPSVAGLPLMDCSRTSSSPPPVRCPRPLFLVPDDEGLRGLPRRGGHRRPAPGRAAGPNHLYHRIMGENRRGIALMQSLYKYCTSTHSISNDRNTHP